MQNKIKITPTSKQSILTIERKLWMQAKKFNERDEIRKIRYS